VLLFSSNIFMGKVPLRLLCILTVFALGPGAFAQVTTGSISGFVFDPSGRAVPDALIVSVDLEQRIQRRASTDSAGYYRLPELPARGYKVQTNAPGFAEASTTVLVSVNAAVRADFHLTLAGQQQSANVEAEVHSIQTESSELGEVLDRATIATLPLNRRDFLQLALLSPGVMPPVQGSGLSNRGSFAMHVNGGREELNNFLLDGIDNNDGENNRYSLQPPVDAIQEFKIATNAYNAEYGRNGAGQVNVVTRSGTNEWHGFGYEYFRNRVLDARNFFDANERAKYNRSQFGAGAGGPLQKNRIFVFGNYDGLRERSGLSRLATVPSLEARGGDLSDLTQTIKDPFTGVPFPGNRIPASRIAPLAQRILDLFPLPTRLGRAGNYLAQPVIRGTENQSNVKVDIGITERQQLSLRYSHGGKDLFEPFGEQSTDVPGFGDYVDDGAHNGMLRHVLVLGPRATNSLLVGVNRVTRLVLPQNYTTDVNRLWGVDYLPSRPIDFGFPAINIAGLSTVGDITAIPIQRALTTYQLSDSFSVVRGAHTINLGGESRNTRQNGILDQLVRGSISFSGALSGSGISDLLLGLPSFGLQSQADNPQAQRTTAYNFWLQDDWKVHRKLSLNIGLRYEYNTPPVDPQDRMSAFNLQTRTLSRVGTGGVSRSGIEPDHNNLAPRIGFAWAITPTFVARGGYGIYYDSGMLVVNSAQYFNPPYFNVRVFFPTPSSLLTLNNPFPSKGGLAPPASLSTLNPGFTTAYMQHWNFTFQKELAPLTTLSVGYVASKGTNLVRSRDLNQPAPGPGPLGPRRPYPQFGNIFFIESGANSTYHSFQTSFHRTMRHGFSIVALYTFSKSIDDTSAFLGTSADKNFPQDSNNYSAERALSSFDLPHRASAAWVYAIPGHNIFLRNTDIRGIFVAQSGRPFTPLLRFDNSNTGNTGGTFGSDRPNVLRNPQLSHRTPEQWFDPSAFAVPAPYTFGSAGRNVLRGPAFSSIDLSLARRFKLNEQFTVTCEAEAFNLLNHTNFDLPEAFADEPARFGKIFSAKAPRQVQLALRFEF
jgi:hypothetical protein